MTDTSDSASERPVHGRPAALGFIFAAVLLDVMALGVVIPVLPRLILELTGGNAGQAARYIGWFGAVWALMQFFASPVLGALSDRFGRRPVLLLSMLGLGLDYVVMALAPTLAWLFLGRVLSGVTAATFGTANAYIADITPPDQRAARFGLLSVAFGLGFILGPAIGGLLGGLDPRLPFWVAAGLSLANALYGVFVLPESLPRSARAKFSFRMANPIGSFVLYRERRGLLLLAAIMLLYSLAHQVLQSTFVPYVDYRYGWSAQMVGLSLALVGLGSITVQGLVVRRFVARFGERVALAAGLLMAALGFTAYAAAPTTMLFLLGIPLFAFMGLVGPSMQGLMSRSVSAQEQGRLQGANMGVMSIGNLLGPILFTEVFARAIGGWRAWAPVGAPFYVAAGLMVTALLLAAATKPPAAAPLA
ncbi:TCR/Tet family MFS transporter [Phenylobacterium sp.]|uniref:TCR/Tet family MFS transporter n=1 Tax=Phenylobacterium sp. TaxID=1871053 RepID=UPI0027333F55|nr:TCR/Tet family MFS transporter [Phenylobacterium sp.]MDP3659021.1 TCR/Tet family MFS transporter [Phenylobacterium sp.]